MADKNEPKALEPVEKKPSASEIYKNKIME